MSKILNIDEMNLIADETIHILNENISSADDPQLVVNETLIQCAAELAFMNYISSATTSDEGILEVFNYHFDKISQSMRNNIDQKAIN
jgi:hypothetical protein